jgi:Predicted ATPase
VPTLDPCNGNYNPNPANQLLRRLRPADVISIAISPEKQDQQNIGKLRGLSPDSWVKLVDLIDEKGNLAAVEDVTKLLHLDKGQEVEALAARSNMTKIVKSLHDKESQLMDILLHALKEGKLCVIDISQMRGSQSLILSSIILRRIFDHNQDQFTEAVPKTIPVLAVIEEAQSVLKERVAGAEPYIEWVKEGRKYDLGAVLITQQPGSIPNEILSQGDNWFLFHLLSAADLQNIKNANAHFSADILSGLLNEPIPGQGVFWSSSSGRPYPVAIRVLSFEKMYELQDHDYNRPQVETFAGHLRNEHAPIADALTGEVDQLVLLRWRAVEEFRNDVQLMKRMGEESGVAWGELKKRIFDVLPEHISDRDQLAYQMVSQVLNELLGEQDIHWESFKNPSGKTWVRRIMA